jgi:hypothetical protein
MSKEDLMAVMDRTERYAARYKWLRENPQAMTIRLSREALDAYLDQRIAEHVFKTGEDLL